MKCELGLYDLMDCAIERMTLATDLTTLHRAWDRSVDESCKYINNRDISLHTRIAYRAWLDQTYLMLRTYMKE